MLKSMRVLGKLKLEPEVVYFPTNKISQFYIIGFVYYELNQAGVVELVDTQDLTN